ncbi:hypothetical protein LTR84_012759 [Exophiala bonariae]|uniref:Uncharacterized protein n=1 Tax=Exophiala bonariae TaxID=1690606 RepID=A0AAV9NF35_9EURO|nr:hypothetical protein LTR84_012759 [Exophiala bonariae]
MSRTSRRGPWLPEEDGTLLHLVRTQGPNNWVRISQHMQHRSPKQCRERYHQNLKPTLNHEPISNEEGDVIEQLVQEMGKRWAEIARRLGNRSDNAVKNWWNGSMNRRKRSVQQGGNSKGVGFRSQPIPASASPRPYHSDHSSQSRERYGLNYSFPPPFQRHESTNSLPSLTDSPMRPDFSDNQYATRSYGEYGYLKSSSFPPLDRLPPTPRELRPPYSGDPFPSPLLRDPLASLQRPEASKIQLPPIQYLERPIPSPAATDVSHASPTQQAPSLVSDNQSNCSISPKTVPSPRPAINAVKGLPAQIWDNSPREETLDACSPKERPRTLSPVESSLLRAQNSTLKGEDHGVANAQKGDHRMTLSRLLG